MAKHLFEFEAEELYMNMLDDCYPSVKLTGDMEYRMSVVLKSVDPIVFRIGLDEYITSMVEDGEWMVDGYEEYAPEGVEA